jgi:YD repeat-containing protein
MRYLAMNRMDYNYPVGLTNNRLGIVGDVNSLYSTKYGYDPNGNVISDLAPGISGIDYDWRNRPTRMVAGAASYAYRYDGSGQRVYRNVQPATGGAQVEYFLPGMVLFGSGAIKRLDISEGYAEITQNGILNRNYILRDEIS